jgi:orotate phosphoribosyltransferase
MSKPDWRLEAQKINLLNLVKHGEIAFSDTWYPYTSGEVGPYYIQSVGIERDGRDYQFAIDSLVRLILEQTREWGQAFHAISGGESRDWDFSNPVAYALRLPHLKLYETRAPLGARIADTKFVHVADLNNEGSSMRDKWVPQIRNAGGSVTGAFFFVDRQEAGVAVMKELGIPNDSVVPMNQYSWQVLRERAIVSDSLYRSLNERSEDRHAWGVRALREHPEQLISILQNPATRAKGEKILNKGYPDVRHEIIAVMKSYGYDYTPGAPGGVQ